MNMAIIVTVTNMISMASMFYLCDIIFILI